MKQGPRKQGEHFWPKIVLRKLLNISSRDSDFGADEKDTEFDSSEETCDSDLESHEAAKRPGGIQDNYSESTPFRLRRRNSETVRSQYINTKELRICVGTWNVAGKLPSEDLDIKEWLDMNNPADIYVLGFQEIVPLNAGNIFGAEDSRPVPRWENLIRETLNSIQPVKTEYKSYSSPPSPSKFKLSDDAPFTLDELLFESDSDENDKVHPLDEKSFSLHVDSGGYAVRVDDSNGNVTSSSTCTSEASTTRRLDRCQHFSLINYEESSDALVPLQKKLTKTLSSSQRIGLVWPEQPLDLFANYNSERSNTLKSLKSFRACSSLKPEHCKGLSEINFIPDLCLEKLRSIKKRPPYVRIISKQMVGIFVSIWVRRSLRKNIQNLKVSTVGVGAMGYIGNKGSISVSMSIYQTLFCFVCSHLSSGEKDGDERRRNADVQETHRRTQFNTVQSMGLPKTIQDHERIFWFGDLNYRINLSYERSHALISKRRWFELAEMDQLKRQLKKGRAFDGWSEGVLNFPPTYKYEFNSGKYIADDTKAGRRTPAWCDRVLSFGKGIRLFTYKGTELRLSDHHPVTAIFTAEVEVFCHKKLQRALTLTDAEIEEGNIISEMEMDVEDGRQTLSEEFCEWAR